MRKLIYRFENGVVFTTLFEAKEYASEAGLKYTEDFEEIPAPVEFTQDGVDWEKAGRVRVPLGLRTTSVSNLAKRGWYTTTQKGAAEATIKKMNESK